MLVVYFIFMLWIGTFFGFTGYFSYINKQIWLIFIIAVLAVWFYVFFHKSRWKEIIKEFENETEKQRKKRRILSVTFTVSSIIIFIVSFFVLAYIHNGDTPF